MAKRKVAKLRNGHIAIEADHPKARHMYEVAEELGCTITDLVGEERAEFYPRNKSEAEIIQAMRRMPDAEREALSLMLSAASLGEFSAETIQRMSNAKDPNAALMGWRNGLVAEQVARYRSTP